MKQILAIFRKDTRHLWAEIFISLALQIALVVLYPRQSRHPGLGAVSYSFAGFVAHDSVSGQLLIILIPISWWVLLARLVHEERLVGHTQFWITRPYRWPLLLAAKLLFVAAFIYLPSLMDQCILLRVAGFHPLSYVPGLLFNALLLTGILTLPLMALAVLTNNIARMTLVILGILAYFAAVASAAGFAPRLASSPNLISGFLLFAVLVCGAAAILLVQYARRRTRTAWLLLAAVAMLLGSSAFYDADQPFMNRWYPPASANAAPSAQFTLSTNPMMQPIAHGSEKKGLIEIAIPFHVDGVASQSVVIPTAIKATLDAGSARWESPWEIVIPEKFMPGSHDTVMRVRMRRETYEQFRTGPVALHVTFAIDQAHAVRENTIALPASSFEVPGFAVCTPETGWDNGPVTVGIGCLSAMREPDLTFVTALWHDDCRPLTSTPQTSAPQTSISGSGWAGSLDTTPATFNLTAVWGVPMALTNSWRYSNRSDEQRIHMRQLCPGSPLTFTTYQLETRTRAELSIPGFRLPELSQATTAEYQTQ